MKIGLSWRTILHKREAFRRAFKNFDIGKVARFTEKDIQRLLQDKGIVRNQQKIRAMVNNALRIEEIQEEFGSFDSYIWQFTAHETIIGSASDTWENLRSTSSESGSTICYAFMQAVGMVDDHLVTCFRFKQR
jgi:DNA-3-methyladenine glycosylase I